jgi:Phosphoenolpyruvate carboxykinase
LDGEVIACVHSTEVWVDAASGYLFTTSYYISNKFLANMSPFNLEQHEIAVEEIHRNLAPSALYEHAILYEKDAHIAENGALVAYSGVKTGRSPKDKRVVVF